MLTDTSHLMSKFFNTVMIFQYLAGLNIMSAISTERCLSVPWPIWYRHYPRHLSAVICALLWALSLLLSILTGAYCGFLINDLESDACQEFELIILAWLAVLFVILTGSSLVLLARILSFLQGMPPTRLYVPSCSQYWSSSSVAGPLELIGSFYSGLRSQMHHSFVMFF